MENKSPVWVRYAIALCGIWLMASTVSFGFQNKALILSDLISGFLLVLFCRNKYAVATIGIWLQLAPLLFWAPTSGAYVTNTLIGVLAICLAVIFFQPVDDEPTVPPGWSYNPSSWAQRFPIAFFAFLSWMISRYLAAYQLGYIDTVWDPFFGVGTQRVLESSVSNLFPVSDAGLGAFAYTLEFLTTIQGGKARWRTSPWGVLLFGILVVPVGIVSTILIILQPLVVGAWCSLCLLTAICMLIPIPLAIDEVVATLQYLKRKRDISGAKQDKRTPPINAPFSQTLRASLWGVTFPWNLIVTTLIGIYLMTLKQLDPMLGALTIVFSVISFSEHLRLMRYFNILIAVLMVFFAMLIEGQVIFHSIIALALVIFSIRRGQIKYANHTM